MNVVLVVAVVLFVAVESIVLLYFHKGAYKIRIDFGKNMEKIGLPIVTFTQGEKSFLFVVDSGADQCLLNKKMLDRIGHIQLEGERQAYGLEGNYVKASYVGIELFHNSQPFVDVFQVLDVPGFENVLEESGVEISGLLGNTFLKKYGFVMDFKKCRICTNGKVLKKKGL